MSLYDRIRQIDRRVIFLMIALAVIIPLILQPRFPDVASPIVQNIYDKIESLPPGSRMLLAFDYGPDTAPELDPMAVSVIRHCMARDIRLYIMTLWPEGAGQIKKITERMFPGEFPEKRYGDDYVNFGFKAGGIGAINTMVASFRTLMPADAQGTPVENIPMMAGINTLKDFDVIMSLTSGTPGLKEWILFAGDVADIPIMGGGTAVMAPELYPYYPQQMVGLMGGLKGASEYEAALAQGYPQMQNRAMDATVRMGPQVVTHIVIVLLVILGNITYFVDRRRERQNRGIGK